MIVGPCRNSKKASSNRLVDLVEHRRPVTFCHRHHRSVNHVQFSLQHCTVINGLAAHNDRITACLHGIRTSLIGLRKPQNRQGQALPPARKSPDDHSTLCTVLLC